MSIMSVHYLLIAGPMQWNSGVTNAIDNGQLFMSSMRESRSAIRVAIGDDCLRHHRGECDRY